jgi:hypothetical protein
MFFSNLKLKIRKRTFINVLFSKTQNTFEKTLHHSLLQRPPSAVCEPYLYALDWSWRRGHVQTIMQWFESSLKVRRKLA